MVGLACSQIIMGPLSDRFGRRPVLLGGLTLMVLASIGCIFAADAAATDRRALPAGAGRRLRHGDQPRHHPRSLQPRPRRRHDQPGHRGDDDRADAEPAVRRPDRNRVRLARDLLRHHRRRAHRRGRDRAGAAGDAAPRRPCARQRLSRRRRQPVQEPRLHRLCAVPGAGLGDHLHLRGRRALCRGDADGPHQRRIRRLVRHLRLRLSARQSVLRALLAAPLARQTDLVRPGAADRRRAAQPGVGRARLESGCRPGCSAPT